jgi:hypothetical protein
MTTREEPGEIHRIEAPHEVTAHREMIGMARTLLIAVLVRPMRMKDSKTERQSHYAPKAIS